MTEPTTPPPDRAASSSGGSPADPAGGLAGGVLLFVVFWTGWAMMGLEIVGGRLLQTDFGSQIHVWGSIIGVFLLSLSAGYLLGGKLSLRVVHPRALSIVIAASGLLILALPLFRRQLAAFVADGVDDGPWGCLLAATALFLAPTALLGVVSPYAIRLTTRRLDSVGDRAGQLYAVSTIGSFLGTVVTSFYLIVWMGTDGILRAEGIGLLAIAMAIEVAGRVAVRGKGGDA